MPNLNPLSLTRSAFFSWGGVLCRSTWSTATLSTTICDRNKWNFHGVLLTIFSDPHWLDITTKLGPSSQIRISFLTRTSVRLDSSVAVYKVSAAYYGNALFFRNPADSHQELPEYSPCHFIVTSPRLL